MTTLNLIVLILGATASVIQIIAALSVHRFRLLLFGIIAGVIVSIEYGLTGATAGLVINVIGMVRTFMVMGSFRKPWLNHWLFIPVFLVLHTLAWYLTTDFSNLSFFSFVPLAGGWGGTIALYFVKVINIKAILIVVGGMWLFYEFNNSMYTQMIGESLNLVSNCVAFTTLFLALRAGIPEKNVEDLDTRFIETLTSSITLSGKLEEALTSLIHLPRLHTTSNPTIK